MNDRDTEPTPLNRDSAKYKGERRHRSGEKTPARSFLQWWRWLVALALIMAALGWLYGRAQKPPVNGANASAGAGGKFLKRQQILYAGEWRQGYAIDRTGQVWAWGSDSSASQSVQLESLKPRKLAGPGGIVALAANKQTVIALREDGTVWVLGSVPHKAPAASAPTNLPFVKVPSLASVKHVAVSDETAYAVNAQGQLWAWGVNAWGQMGQIPAIGESASIPQLINAPADLVSIQTVADGQALVGIDRQGKVWGWGALAPLLRVSLTDPSQTISLEPEELKALNADEYGKLANPPRVHEPIAVRQVRTGAPSFSGGIAIHTDDSVSVWGIRNEDRCLSSGNANLPTQNSTLGPATSVAVGEYGRYSVKTDGSLWMWGTRWKWQPGGYIGPCMREPGLVTAPGTVKEIVASPVVQHILKADGTVWTWGTQPKPNDPFRNAKLVVFEEAFQIEGLPKLLD